MKRKSHFKILISETKSHVKTFKHTMFIIDCLTHVYENNHVMDVIKDKSINFIVSLKQTGHLFERYVNLAYKIQFEV